MVPKADFSQYHDIYNICIIIFETLFFFFCSYLTTVNENAGRIKYSIFQCPIFV